MTGQTWFLFLLHVQVHNHLAFLFDLRQTLTWLVESPSIATRIVVDFQLIIRLNGELCGLSDFKVFAGHFEVIVTQGVFPRAQPLFDYPGTNSVFPFPESAFWCEPRLSLTRTRHVRLWRVCHC